MNKAYLLIGGNLGNRAENLTVARRLIGENCGTVLKESSVYETDAWGKPDQPAFLNQALCIKTALNARQLIRTILKLEKKMGRIRYEKLGPRIIDMDIIFFNDEMHSTSFLKIPHPAIQDRRFGLEPLAEIAPDYKHPVFKKTIFQLLEECPDQLPVKKIV